MEENQRARLSCVQASLPWIVALVALLLYTLTLNRWVTLDSLPYVAKVTGWDWTLPFQTPLFFTLTYPLRWLPASWQPVCLNFFSALCAALTLALLARSVALLPHDRTHEQRQRERSEFSLLSIPTAWLPPLLAVLVCGLELTFWENATAATTEMLDLLLFAYVVRCLLEFRVSQDDSWLTRMSLVFGLAVTNNYAMIAFFPCVLIAVLWMKGLSFFEFRFCLRMLLFGLLGLTVYCILPLVWSMSDNTTVGFWQALRAHLASQKAMLVESQLRTRVVVLSLTSVLPILIIAIRWPATFGDTSAAGAAFSSFMFRLIHTVFLGACIWVAFDQQFSPRSLGFGLAFLPFYYLGALSIGYFSGYLLLVFGEGRSRSRQRRSAPSTLAGWLVVAAVWVAFLAAPVALVAKNWNSLKVTNGPLLHDFTELSARALPAQGSLVLSDDAYTLLLLTATLSRDGALDRHVLVHTRSLVSPDYHRQLAKRYPKRWPGIFNNQAPDEIVDDASLVVLMNALSRTNQIYYLHPSFGYYFEQFYSHPHGLVYQLHSYSTNAVFPPPLNSTELQANNEFWAAQEPALKKLVDQAKLDSRGARFLRSYYSRALDYWGVALQRAEGLPTAQRLEQSGKYFKLAFDLNTNNIPAESNLDFNRSLRTREPHTPQTAKMIEDKFGIYRGWEGLLVENGPFDHPDFCIRLGQIFAQQGLYRQAVIQFDRVATLDPTNVVARVALADVYLSSKLPEKTLEIIAKIRAEAAAEAQPTEVELELARLEATAQFGLGKIDVADKILRDAFAKHPKNPGVLDPLLQIYAQTERVPQALELADQIINADPERVQSFINKAKLYRNQQQPDKALEALEQVLRKYPSNPQALLYKVFILTQKKDYATAKAETERLLNVEPENSDALLYKAVINIDTKAYAKAIEPLDLILKQQPTNVDALRNRAIANLELGELNKAERDYDAIRRLVARDYVYVAYYGLGEVAYRRKDMDRARKYYGLYLQYSPSQETAELKEEKKMVADRLQVMQQAKR